MPESDPNWSNHQSSIYPSGRQTIGSNYHTSDPAGLTVAVVQPVGLDKVTKLPVPIESTKGNLNTIDGGFSSDNNNIIYYVRESDITTYTGKYVPGSEGKPKKIVVFPRGSVAGYKAQVTIFLYQAAPIPTSVTTIYVYEEDVSYYLDGAGALNYDYNSAAQNNIIPN